MTLDPAIARGENVATDSDCSRIAPIAAWLLVQVVVLLLAAARVPLWARFDGAIESWALCWMLAVQVAASALLFPWLMSDLRAGISVTVISFPFILLAGLLTREPFAITLRACGGMLLWLTALAVWRIVLTSRTMQLLAAAIASIATIGVACLIYLAIEFNDAKVLEEKAIGWSWIALGANFLAALLASFVHRRLRAKLSTV